MIRGPKPRGPKAGRSLARGHGICRCCPKCRSKPCDVRRSKPCDIRRAKPCDAEVVHAPACASMACKARSNIVLFSSSQAGLPAVPHCLCAVQTWKYAYGHNYVCVRVRMHIYIHARSVARLRPAHRIMIIISIIIVSSIVICIHIQDTIVHSHLYTHD